MHEYIERFKNLFSPKKIEQVANAVENQPEEVAKVVENARDGMKVELGLIKNCNNVIFPKEEIEFGSLSSVQAGIEFPVSNGEIESDLLYGKNGEEIEIISRDHSAVKDVLNGITLEDYLDQ